ncbi:MAG: hypothetical protein AB7S26_36290 [Sandaracinaceae bacterium]
MGGKPLGRTGGASAGATFVEGMGALASGDVCAASGAPVDGSAKCVRIGGRAVAREGDPTLAGSSVVDGASTVRVGLGGQLGNAEVGTRVCLAQPGVIFLGLDNTALEAVRQLMGVEGSTLSQSDIADMAPDHGPGRRDLEDIQRWIGRGGISTTLLPDIHDPRLLDSLAEGHVAIVDIQDRWGTRPAVLTAIHFDANGKPDQYIVNDPAMPSCGVVVSASEMEEMTTFDDGRPHVLIVDRPLLS